VHGARFFIEFLEAADKLPMEASLTLCSGSQASLCRIASRHKPGGRFHAFWFNIIVTGRVPPETHAPKTFLQ
jgi:hypothetical protein